MDATVVIREVREREGQKGTIFTLVDGNGTEFLTKNREIAAKAKEAGERQVRIAYTPLPGNLRNDGTRWPDSKWVDKDGLTVQAAPAAARGGGGMSPEDILRVTRLSAMSTAGMIFSGREVAPDTLKAVADFVVEYAFGRLPEAAPEPEPEPTFATAAAGSFDPDDIPF